MLATAALDRGGRFRLKGAGTAARPDAPHGRLRRAAWGNSEDRANVTRATIHTKTVDEDEMRLRARRCEALLEALRAASSATAALSAWARSRGWDGRILARKLETATRPAPEEVARLLEVPPGEPIGFRQVELASGARVLSRADNWYAPGRLPGAVNAGLCDGSIPFGALVAPLEPRRQVLGVAPLWKGALQDWRELTPPQALFRLSAVVTGLCAGQRMPLAVVSETYLAALAI